MPREEWDWIYRNYELEDMPWHTIRPDRSLVSLVKEGKIRPGLALDMCSGAGTNSIYLASKGFKVFGIDISPTAVRIAKFRCSKKKQVCNYVAGDVLKAKFGEKFDFILDRGCFHHIPPEDKPAYAKRLYELLGKNGKVHLKCFSDRNPPFEKNLSKEDIIRYFSKYFKIISIEDSVHTEPGSGEKRYFHSVFMERE